MNARGGSESRADDRDTVLNKRERQYIYSTIKRSFLGKFYFSVRKSLEIGCFNYSGSSHGSKWVNIS